MNNLEFSEKPIVKLDLKDRKLLFELDFHARLGYSQLAKRVGLSKQGVEYKLKNLIKKGVVQQFYPVINMPRLGYIYTRIMLTMQNLTKESYIQIINYLKNHKKVFWLFKMQGIHDLWVIIWTKSLTEINEFIDEIEDRFGNFIKNKSEIIATNVVHYQFRFFLGLRDTEEIHIKETKERVEIDELDKEILRLLCEDARYPVVRIAEKVDQSAKVVAYRIKRMEERKLIEGYRPSIDHLRIGYTYYKLFINLNRYSSKEISQLKSYIKSNPIVIYIVEGIGMPSDIDVEIMVSSNRQLFDFIEDLKFKFPALIGEYQTVIFIDTLKVKYLPF